MIITSSVGLVALYISSACAVKTRNDGYMYTEEMVKRVLKEIKQIKRKVT